MADDTLKVLNRLRRRMDQEKRFFQKIFRSPTADPLTKERAFGEQNVCATMIRLVDAEIRRVKGP